MFDLSPELPRLAGERSKQLFRQSLILSALLHAIFTARNFIVGNRAQKAERENVKAIISNDQYYPSDNVPISKVLPDFHELPSQFKVLREKMVSKTKMN